MKYFRNCFFLMLSIGLFSIARAQTERKHIKFDEDWKFHFGNASEPKNDFNYGIDPFFYKTLKETKSVINTNFNDNSWRTLTLPHDWAVELPFDNSTNNEIKDRGYKPVGALYPANSIGWYRKHFKVSASDSGQRFSLQFDGVLSNSTVWINGIYLNNNKSGYIGMDYDITDFVNFNKDNVITVRADVTKGEGWFYEGAGINRHVWLNQYNNVHIATNGVFVSSTLQNNVGMVQVETDIKNQNFSSSLPSTVYCYVVDRNGNELAHVESRPFVLAINENKKTVQQINIPTPKLWSLEDPYLYRMVTVVKQNGQIIDQKTTRFGIRTITMTVADGLLLNGKSVKIKGVNNHQDFAGVGVAVPDALQYYRIHLLKEMGANAWRTSHSAVAPELLDACDSLGMLVLDENRLTNSGPEYMGQFEQLILRDRNHPSIFLWSIGNEEGDLQQTTTGKRIAQTLLAKQMELDPSRTSTYAADMGNVYHGINEVIPIRGFNYREFGVADYHKDHPKQLIIGTEMGSTLSTRGIYTKDTVNCYLPDEDITFPWWASTAEKWWSLSAPNKFWLGGFIWTGFDYRGEPTPFEWPNINSHFGMMDMCGFPKNIYYYYQSWWADKDVLHIATHWNWKGKEGQPVDVWVNSNADNVELRLNGKSLGKKTMPINGHLQWQVTYQPGKLEAVAYKNGKKITAKVETTTEAFELQLTPFKTILLANGEDATVVNVTVVDKLGREVPDANNLVHFSITPNAQIIGVGNGDPSSHEADRGMTNNWQRKLFNGKCQFIIQAKKTTGTIQLTATCNGLKEAHNNVEIK